MSPIGGCAVRALVTAAPSVLVRSSPFSLFTKGLPQEKRKPFMEVRAAASPYPAAAAVL